jgi:signal transduction histidine kinase
MNAPQQRIRRLERILSVSRDLTSTVALEPLLKRIVDTATEVSASEAASILLKNPRTGELHFRASSDGSAEQLVSIPVPVEGSIAGAVLSSGEPLIVNDTRADPRHYGEVGEQIGMEIRSLVAVPLQIDDRRIGVLELINRGGDRPFTPEDVETLTLLAAQAAVAIENARLVTELREANARLEKLGRLKSDVLTIVSHELCTPLSLIFGYASLLRTEVNAGEAGSQLQILYDAALRLKQNIETMLNLRYPETGKTAPSFGRFDLRETVAEACEDYGPLVRGQGLKLTAATSPEPILVRADRYKIGVVLDNLLSNAVKFTPPGGEIYVTSVVRGNRVEVAVIDSGEGIPEEALERIFEPFEQSDDLLTRRHGGLGLGLPIARGLVEQHGGQLWAENVPDGGSRFVFTLPAAQENSSS